MDRFPAARAPELVSNRQGEGSSGTPPTPSPMAAQMPASTEGTPHEHGAHQHADCPQCLMSPTRPGTKLPWAIAAIAVALLLGVLFLGVGSAGATTLSFAAIPLLGVLVCPLVMGGMMWVMMRKH